MTQEDAIKYLHGAYAMFTPINMDKESGIRKKREFTTWIVLKNDLFPHCHNLDSKGIFLRLHD